MNWMSVFSATMYSLRIFAADLIFLSAFKKRKLFFLRLLIPLALSAVAMFSMLSIPYNGEPLLNFAQLLVTNIALFAGFMFCYKTTLPNMLFSCTAGMALEQFTNCLLILINLGFSFGSVVPNHYVASLLDRIMLFVPLYTAFAVVFRRIMKNRPFDGTVNLKMNIMSASIVFICIGIYRFTTGAMTTEWIVARSLYSMTCCLFALVIQYGFHGEILLRKNLSIANELYRQEIKHYDKWRDSLELINIKYHDLKHRISAAKSNKDDKEWADIENALAVYENMLKTGNDVLDNILSEKRMLGESFNVSMTCMVDGGALEGITDADIFALFGNALDNALNAVKLVEDESKRNISVIVRRVGEATAIHVENYYVGQLNFYDGLPQTAEDKNFHGFGMKSIKIITEKYNGTMSMSSENNIFILDIMLLPKSVMS